jgi:hypothetical protein
VKRSFVASLAAFALIGWSFASSAHAQNHNSSSGTSAPAPSATAAFSGHSVTGPVNPPTGVVVGHTPTVGSAFHSAQPTPPPHPGNGDRPYHSHTYPSYGEVYLYPVPVGVADSANDQDADADDESDYQGGPTIFDRRGSGADSYIPPVANAPAAHSAQSEAENSTEPVPVTPTVLVFKDQHTIDVSNYAIVGQTLFDLTPGHARRIALASLDLDATQKQNDDRGIDFRLPPQSQAN